MMFAIAIKVVIGTFIARTITYNLVEYPYWLNYVLGFMGYCTIDSIERVVRL